MEDSAQPYRLLKVRNLESSKRDHFRPDPVPFDRPMTYWQLLWTKILHDEYGLRPTARWRARTGVTFMTRPGT